jgi:hypothetical protein
MAHIFIISTNDRDRNAAIININGWKLGNYQGNPIVQWEIPAMFAPADPDELIGTSRVWFENNKLFAEWYPDPTSEIATKIVKKLTNGTSLGASVNFLPIEGHYGKGSEAKAGSKETYYHEKQELLSWKICRIPSNPFCVYQKHLVNFGRKKEESKRMIDKKFQALQKKRMHFMISDLKKTI